MNKALIVIDLEKEWVNKDSDYYLGDISETIKKVNELIDYCRKNNYKIIFIKHVEKNPEDGFQEGTENIELIEDLHFQEGDSIVIKNKINAFYKTNIEEELEGIGKVVVCGALVNMCVRCFIEGAYDREFEIKVIKNCCLAFDKETLDFTFKDLKETREEIEFLNLEEFIQ